MAKTRTHQQRGIDPAAQEMLIRFALTFIVTLGVTASVTFLWSLIFHGASAVDWETALRLAIILAIVLPWAQAWDGRTAGK